MNELVTADEIARRLQLKPSTIKRWSQEGLIPSLRVTGKVIRFDPTAVELALRERAEARRTFKNRNGVTL